MLKRQAACCTEQGEVLTTQRLSKRKGRLPPGCSSALPASFGWIHSQCKRPCSSKMRARLPLYHRLSCCL